MIRLLAPLIFALWPAQAWSACDRVEFDGAPFTLCTIDLAEADVRLFLRDDEGLVFGSFARVAEALPDGEQLSLAMNAGMFHDDRSPVGLYVEDGEQEMRIITSDGPGNFGLLPNGVFCLSNGTAAVIESRQFAADPPACRYASQSGPMLVIDGALHPRFRRDSTSLNIRNGVGVDAAGQVLWMVISDEPVNFHHFGRFFRDHLGSDNALYFDGRISRLHAPAIGRSDLGFPVGPILGVVERPDVASGDG